MRLRNIPRAESVLENSEDVIKDPARFQGRFRQDIFQEPNPLHIEIGMGKGQFLLTLAARNPSVNLLKRLADGMGMVLKIEFVPKQKV